VTGWWCPMCRATIEPEWVAVADVALPFHRAGESMHAIRLPAGYSRQYGKQRIQREVVVREDGQYRTVEPTADV
jgi:hypothetical protein